MTAVINYKAVRRSFRMLGSSIGSALVGFLQSGTGAEGRTAQDKMRDVVSILDFIPAGEHAAIKAGTSTYDCYASLVEAINSYTLVPLGITVLSGGPEIYFPPGLYNINSTVHLKRRVRLRGAVGGQAGGWSSYLKFPADVGAFVVHKENTNAAGVESPSTTGADGTIIEGLTLYGGGGTSNSAHGIWMRARAVVRDCVIQNFGAANGIHILASAGGGGLIEGNANSFLLSNLRIATCHHAVYVDGADSNAGVGIEIDASLNTGWAIYDSSFLGNTWVGCHSDANDLGSYKSDSANARTLFLGCYSEGGHPTADITYPAMVVGGIHGTGITGTFVDIQSYPTRLQGQAVASTGETLTLDAGSVDSADANVFQLKSSDESLSQFRLKYRTGRWFMNRGNTGIDILSIYNESATVANSYARNVTGGRIGFNGYFLGNSTEMKYRNVGSAAPVAGTWIVGDKVEILSPTAGGPEGWICVTAGTPGTWEPYGVVNLSGSATYDPGSLADGEGVTTTVTVTGAALGDYALASFSLALQGITVTAWVSAANTVSVRFQNESGGVLDLASGTLRARVLKA